MNWLILEKELWQYIIFILPLKDKFKMPYICKTIKEIIEDGEITKLYKSIDIYKFLNKVFKNLFYDKPIIKKIKENNYAMIINNHILTTNKKHRPHNKFWGKYNNELSLVSKNAFLQESHIYYKRYSITTHNTNKKQLFFAINRYKDIFTDGKKFYLFSEGHISIIDENLLTIEHFYDNIFKQNSLDVNKYKVNCVDKYIIFVNDIHIIIYDYRKNKIMWRFNLPKETEIYEYKHPYITFYVKQSKNKLLEIGYCDIDHQTIKKFKCDDIYKKKLLHLRIIKDHLMCINSENKTLDLYDLETNEHVFNNELNPLIEDLNITENLYLYVSTEEYKKKIHYCQN